MSVRFILSGAALLGLTACGGGGGSSTGLPSSGLGDMTASGAELVSALDNFSSVARTGETSAAQLPNGGTATYGGAVVISEDLYNSGTIITVTGDQIIDNVPGFATSGYFGEVELTANFSDTTRTLSGSASNFHTATFNGTNGSVTSIASSPITGTINLTATANDTQYTATELPLAVSGNIGGLTTTGTIPSTFFANAQGVLGEGGGTLSIDGTPNDVILIAQPR